MIKDVGTGKASCLDLSASTVRIHLPLVQIPKLSESLYNLKRYWYPLKINFTELEQYQVSVMYYPTSDLGIHVPCGAPMLLSSMCICHTGLYSISDLETLNFQLSSPRASTNLLSDALMHPSQCGFTGGYTNARFMTKHIECRPCDFWTMRVRISIYICLRTPTFIEVLGGSGVHCECCAAGAGSPQLVSSPIYFHATPVESGRWLVGSRGVATILYCHRP